MISPKEVLVVTTSSLQNITIQKYLKPVSAHVVAGTNIFSDLAASFTDFWGGRSESYQKQLTSLYDEAIERVKVAAFELGANCVVGLSVDMDEVSGKNKSMFMVTAVGTAVVIEEQPKKENILNTEKLANVRLEKLINYQKKNKIIKDSEQQHWAPDEANWDLITENHVLEVLPALLKKYLGLISFAQNEDAKVFYKRLLAYFNNFPEDAKAGILYDNIISAENENAARMFMTIVKDLNLLDYNFILKMLDNGTFEVQKRALIILTFNKLFYNVEDITDLTKLKQTIIGQFKERGIRTTKKGLLSSKEKDVWICECGKTNDISPFDGDYCLECDKDIWGVKNGGINPLEAIRSIENKINLISQFVQ